MKFYGRLEFKFISRRIVDMLGTMLCYAFMSCFAYIYNVNMNVNLTHYFAKTRVLFKDISDCNACQDKKAHQKLFQA